MEGVEPTPSAPPAPASPPAAATAVSKLGPRGRLFLGLGSLLAVVGAGYLLRNITTPLLAGLLASYVLSGPVRWFERRGMRRGVAVSAVFFVGLMFLVAAVLVVAVSATGLVVRAQDALVGIGEGDEGALGRMRDAFRDRVQSVKIPGDKVAAAFDQLRDVLRAILEAAGRWAASLGEGLFSRAWGLMQLIVLGPLYTFFMLLAWDRIGRGLESLVPRPTRPRVLAVWGRIDVALSAFLRGKVALGVLKGLITWLVLWLLADIELASALGVWNAVSILLPFAGPILGLPVATALCFATEHWGWALLFTVLAFVLAEVVEMVLTPFVLGRGVGIHPVVLIVSILAFGELLGIYGLLLAVPAACVGKILFEEFILPEWRDWAEGPLEVGSDPGGGPPPPAMAPAEAPKADATDVASSA